MASRIGRGSADRCRRTRRRARRIAAPRGERPATPRRPRDGKFSARVASVARRRRRTRPSRSEKRRCACRGDRGSAARMPGTRRLGGAPCRERRCAQCRGAASCGAHARRLMPRTAPLRVPDWPWRFRVHMLGRALIERGNTPVEFSGKGPGRPMELLKVLVANGGHNVRADQLADSLWPHVDADYAHKSFTATLHRLRRLLDDDEAVTLRDGRLSLNPGLVWVDTWALEQAVADSRLEEALALYRGPFLPDEAEQPSYIACR